MSDGGLDPLPIPATIGDTLVISTYRDGIVLELYARAVPERKPPIIVRTDPPRGKTRVPLNSVIVVVFSEPVDDGTVTPTSVRLLRGTQRAGQSRTRSGRPERRDRAADDSRAVFDTHAHRVARGGRLEWRELETQYTSIFTTVDNEVTTTELPPWSGTIALLSNGEAAEDGSGSGHGTCMYCLI